MTFSRHSQTAKGRPSKAPGLKLPDLEGSRLLTVMTERQTQRGIRETALRLLPAGSKVIRHANERPVPVRAGDDPDRAAKAYFGSLLGEGLEDGLSDLQPIWDRRRGAAGNAGTCYIEIKRPVKPQPISAAQLAFMYDMRAMGFVAGWAQCWDHAEALLVEAGAPLRGKAADPRVLPWWAPLGALPPLYADPPGQVRLATGATLRVPA